MWPASMIVGLPSLFPSARLVPATSPLTFANCLACSRHTFAGADSKPEGPGVSSSFLRKPRDSEEIIREEGRERRPEYSIFPEVSAARANDSCSVVQHAVFPNLNFHEKNRHLH